jgi:hypothetical protein
MPVVHHALLKNYEMLIETENSMQTDQNQLKGRRNSSND